jgi:hypothetical protein
MTENIATGSEIVKAKTTASSSYQPNARSLKVFADLIDTSWRKGAAAIIETSRLILDAQSELDRDVFESLLKHLVCGASAGRKLLRIAKNSIICAHGHKLPPSWTTIYELTKLDDEILNTKLADGTIHPGMERKDATALRHPDGEDEGESGGGSTETESPPPFEALVKAWEAASNSDHRALFDRLGRTKVVAAMSDELLTDFHDHIIGQKINTASKSSSFAVNSTGRLHVMLRCAEQKDLSDEDRGKMIAAGRAMIRDAERRGITRSDILVAEGKAQKRKPKTNK